MLVAFDQITFIVIILSFNELATSKSTFTPKTTKSHLVQPYKNNKLVKLNAQKSQEQLSE